VRIDDSVLIGDKDINSDKKSHDNIASSVLTSRRVAIVTGGGRGIGRAVAKGLHDDGYAIAITYNTSENEAFELVREMNNDGQLNAIAVQCDSRDMDNVARAVGEVVKVFGRIDILINNSGIATEGLLIDISYKIWHDIIKVNLDSVYMYAHECLPFMLADGGSIVNIASVWGVYGGSGEVAYSASKAGIIGLTKALSIEMGGNNIRVNAVAPGFIVTDMTSGYSVDDVRDIERRTALGRVGDASEVAEVVRFLASEKASFVTGTVIEVSGGFKG